MTVGRDLASYTSIDTKLEAPPGTFQWGSVKNRKEQGRNPQPIDYETRLSRFFEFAHDPANENPELTKRVRYAKARLAQLESDFLTALPVFEDLAQQEPLRPEPLHRLLQCKLAMEDGSVQEAMSRAVQRFPNCIELWTLLVNASLNDLAKTPAELLETLESMPAEIQQLRNYEDTYYLVGQFRQDEPIRINCGSMVDVVADGKPWHRDMCYRGGYVHHTPTNDIIGVDDPTVFENFHSFHSETGGRYRIPVPDGKYSLTLLFCEAWINGRDGRIFDIAIEDKCVLQDCRPVEIGGYEVAHELKFETTVSDGQLDLDFLPTGPHNADLHGLVIRRLGQ